MILVALGGNVEGPWGPPRRTLERALQALDEGPLRLVSASTIIDTEPFGITGQPSFVNAAAIVESPLDPVSLLARLHAIERAAGRERALRWGPRTLDLDLLDYGGMVASFEGPPALELPHPGIAERSFVLEPVAEIAPRWRHPVSGLTAGEMLALLEREAPAG